MNPYNEYKNIITVIKDNTLIFIKLNTIAMQFFHDTFGGSICNIEQWRYFRVCLGDAIRSTNSSKKIYETIKIKEIPNPLNY